MKLTLKTLQRETFEVEVDENVAVIDLKKKIQEIKGDAYTAENLKLIYAGKILNDEKPLKEYDITAFIVVMVSKPKPVQPQADATAPSSATQSVPTSTQAAPTPPVSTQPAPTQPTPPVVAEQAAAPEQPTSDNMFVSGQEYETAIQEMINMGFERTQIERAMTASFMNPHRAIEYLFNPTTMPAQQPVPQVTSPATQPGATPAATPGNTVAAGGLEFLRNLPQINMLRQMVAQDPQMLQNVLEELGQANPELLQAIQENPQQFINLLNESGGGGGGGGGGQQAPPPGTVQITPAEKEAIDRIKALGFPEHLVVQAYFACEKNENLAAEFLFSDTFNDDGS